MILLALLLPSLISAVLAVVVRPYRRLACWADTALALVAFGASGAIGLHVAAGGVVTFGPAAFLRADALSALLAMLVAGVTVLAAWFGPGLGGASSMEPAVVGRFRGLVHAFGFTMLLAVTTNNVAFTWIAIEATTIASALLIPLHRTKASVEASWRYVMLGSVGIALALGGTVLAYFDFVSAAGARESALNWTVLMAAAPSLHPQVIRLAFVFLVVGYGTKAGLAPMHTWLPDAHSEAPAPVSAMMSGVLLAVAMYAILRWKAVVNLAVGSGFPNTILITMGLLSIGIAAFSLVIQRNYKRMLAYSSVEHTGLISLGLALGPLGVFAAMLHLVNHAVVKSMMFLLAGRVAERYQSTDISRVSGLMRTMPWTGGLFAAGMLALIGLPPFGLFVSEFALVRAGFVAGRLGVTVALLVGLGVAFVAMLLHLNRMLYGERPESVPEGEVHRLQLVPLAVCVAVLAVLGVTVPLALWQLLSRIVEIVG